MNMKTPIVYYGGKQLLAPRIINLIPEHQIYCEPFMGGGAVFCAKEPSHTEIINDLDGMIATFYKVLKYDFVNLKKRVDDTLYDRLTHRFAWFIRKFPHRYTDLDIAWAFFVLSSIGFSGTMDSFGCYTKGSKARTHENRKELFNHELYKRFEGVQIECVDALELITRRDTTDTFFYLDPPYIHTNQGHYRGYTEDDLKNLLEVLRGIKGTFLLSSFPNDALLLAVKRNGWYMKSIDLVSPASKNRKRKTEVLVSNYSIQ